MGTRKRPKESVAVRHEVLRILVGLEKDEKESLALAIEAMKVLSTAEEQNWVVGHKSLQTVAGALVACVVRDPAKAIAAASGRSWGTISKLKSELLYYQGVHKRARQREAQAVRREFALLGHQEEVCSQVVSTFAFFFEAGEFLPPVPFRGFLISGPPGNGKTELAKRAVRRLNTEEGLSVELKFVNSATIAAAVWGQAERNLTKVFSEGLGRQTVVLLDDMECLFIGRASHLAREYHYAINSVLFHQLDTLDPSKVLVLATTNRPDLVDEALMSRFHHIETYALSPAELVTAAEEILSKCWPPWATEEAKEEVYVEISERLMATPKASLRTVQECIVDRCIARGIWCRAVARIR